MVGQLFVGTSLTFLLVSGVVGALVGFERIDLAANDIFGDDLLRAYALHTVTGLFLVVLPLLLGLASAIVPLQVGAATIAFPRATQAAYWTYLASGGLVVASFAVDGGPFGTDAAGVELFLVALVGVLAALTVAAVSVATTVLTLRAPGMRLRNTPLFAWSALVASVVWSLTLPVLAGLMLLAWVDIRQGQQFLGGPGGIYDRIAWAFWQPTVYAFAIPALGIVGDIVPTFARRRLFKHDAALVLVGLFGALGFGAWAQLGFALDAAPTEPPFLFEGPWIAVSFLAIVPVLAFLGLLANTLRLGAPKAGAPLLVGLAGLLLVLIGVAAGGATAIDALDLDGTTWMTAQANLVLIGALTAGLAGVAFWAPKVFGKLLPDPLVGLAGVALFLGALAYAVPDAISGAIGQARLVAGGGVAENDVDTVEVLNLVSAIGGVIVVLGVVGFVLALARPRRGATVADDPWEGHTLEWATTSPPPPGNFAELPEITSEAPVYDARHASTEAAQ
jgi:heme/copper-type cytochrome/quinol oxidase subunit 1